MTITGQHPNHEGIEAKRHPNRPDKPAERLLASCNASTPPNAAPPSRPYKHPVTATYDHPRLKDLHHLRIGQAQFICMSRTHPRSFHRSRHAYEVTREPRSSLRMRRLASCRTKASGKRAKRHGKNALQLLCTPRSASGISSYRSWGADVVEVVQRRERIW
jgi:hypothetical protein